MIANNNCATRKILFGVLLVLVMCLPACSSMSEVDQPVEVRATWTPAAHPTDQPYVVNTDDLSYFGGTPVLVILGSQDPADESPILAYNFSTDDVYDFSSIPPTSADTWSRPIVAENKDVYFQVGSTLYILSPGGAARSIEIPYDEENPAYCNWSWKGQLICLSDSITFGFLVDQDLNIVEMELPTDAEDASAAYHEPYRVGENGMRTVRTSTKTVDGRETVFYRDLNLETLTVQSQEVRIEQDFNRTFYGSNVIEFTQEGGIMYGYGEVEFTQVSGNLSVMGISDDGEKVYLCSVVTYEEDHISKSGFWMETYNTSTLELAQNKIVPNPNVTKRFYRNHLITGVLLDEDNQLIAKSAVYDLESGEALETFLGWRYDYWIIKAIFPYGDGWLAVFNYCLDYHRGNGDMMYRSYLTDAIYYSIVEGNFYTVTQPMEP